MNKNNKGISPFTLKRVDSPWLKNNFIIIDSRNKVLNISNISTLPAFVIEDLNDLKLDWIKDDEAYSLSFSKEVAIIKTIHELLNIKKYYPEIFI